jgi:hypothetical protein
MAAEAISRVRFNDPRLLQLESVDETGLDHFVFVLFGWFRSHFYACLGRLQADFILAAVSRTKALTTTMLDSLATPSRRTRLWSI